MSQPWIYMCSPSRSPLPPPSPSHPSGSSQCTSPEHLSVIFKLAFLWLLQTVRLHRIAFRTIPSGKGCPIRTSSGDFFSGFPLGDPYKTSSAKKILFLKYLKNIILDDLRLFHLFSQFSVYVCLNNHILEEGHGNPLQCSGLETPMDRGAWWATVHGVAKTQTWLKQLSTHANNHLVLVRHFQLL